MSDRDYQGQTPFEKAVLHRLDSIEDMQGYTAMAFLDLLGAIKEDEKVRSQMRATISGLRTDYQEKVAELLHRRAS